MFGEECESMHESREKIERTNKWMNERMNAGLKFCEFLDLKLQIITEYLTFQEFKQNNNNRPFS